MVLPSKNKRRYIIIVNVCRWLLALVLMLSGFLKAADPVGGVYKLQEYVTAFSLSVPDGWLMAATITQATLEFLIGLYLFVGVYRTVVPFMALLAMSLFTPFSLYLWVSGVVSDCGCFGESLAMSNGMTFVKNVVLLLLAVVTFVKRSLFIGCLDRKIRWVLVLFSWIYIFGLQTVAVNHLPLVDSGLYTVGNNLRAMVAYTPGSYRYMSVYEKDGEEVVLPADSVATEGWTLVDSYSEQIAPGSEPEIPNFSIVDWEYDIEVADELLADTGYVCIVVVEDVESASVTHVDKLNDLYDYCSVNGVGFCAVSSSGQDEALLWAKRTGAEYAMYWADKALLRAMIHSNPGLLLLKDGVIVGKWAVADIPVMDDRGDAKTSITSAVATSYTNVQNWPFWVIVLVCALLLLSLLNMIIAVSGIKPRARAEKEAYKPVVDEKTSDMN